MTYYQKPKRSFLTAGLLTLLVTLPIATQAGQYGTVQGKYNPGHYVRLTHFDDAYEMEKVAKPGVVGFKRKYDWNELETAKDVYDFSAVREDIEHAANLGRQYVLMVGDKTFDSVNPMPGYLKGGAYVAKNRKGGYTALRWKTYVNERYNKLLRKLGEEFDGHPAFEGITITESALSLSESVLNNHGYTASKYRNALLKSINTAVAATPNSRVFWYMNYLPRGRAMLDEIAREAAKKDVVLSGPDLLPDSNELQDMVYPLYNKMLGRMPMSISVQFDSYSHNHADRSKPTKYWTMNQLFGYAKNQLKVSYIFWNNKKWRSPADAYNITNVLPVIKNNQQFNAAHFDGTWKDTDNDGISDDDERRIGTKVWNADSDGDGLKDGFELNDVLSDPLRADTDGGGKNDGTEIQQGRNPLRSGDDYGSVPDTDNDGLTNYEEELLGTRKDKRDTDGDGLNDGVEVNTYKTNPLDKNTDRDQVNDRIEIVYKGTDPLDPDTDGGGVMDGVEINRGSNPLKSWDD